MPSRVVRSTLRQTVIRTNAAARREVAREVRVTLEDSHNFLRSVVARWKHKPRLQKRVTVQPTLISGMIEAVGKNATIFRWVDEGTKPHKIPKFARPEVTLKFKTAYSARTAPIARYNVGSGRATGQWRSAKQVMHPGTEPREFMKTTHEEMRPSFRRRIENAIRRGLRRAR